MLGGGTRERFSLSCLFVPLCCIPSVTGRCFALEFIFTLAMAFKFTLCSLVVCLALEAMLIGLAKPATVYHEALNNFQGIFLRIFMVVGIYFMQNLLLFVSGKSFTGWQIEDEPAYVICGNESISVSLSNCSHREGSHHCGGRGVFQSESSGSSDGFSRYLFSPGITDYTNLTMESFSVSWSRTIWSTCSGNRL